MAERKSALRRAPDRPALQARLEAAKAIIMTEADLREQRASFVYGNAPNNSRITKASARTATAGIRLSRSDNTDPTLNV